jgi:hypothetical protein
VRSCQSLRPLPGHANDAPDRRPRFAGCSQADDTARSFGCGFVLPPVVLFLVRGHAAFRAARVLLAMAARSLAGLTRNESDEFCAPVIISTLPAA